MTVICVFFVSRYFSWEEVGFRKINLKQFAWMVPSYLVLATLTFPLLSTIASTAMDSAQWRQLALIGFTTFLVGFSEEVMFRGIVLHAFLTTKRIFWAMLVSAITFSLLHAVNVFGGLPIGAMSIQLLLTFLFGFMFAPLMIKINNIWPLIIFHWLWDFAVIGQEFMGISSGFSSAGIALYVIVGAILWLIIKREQSAERG